MTTTDNRIIARWTLLLCAMTLAFFTGYVLGPGPFSTPRAQPAGGHPAQMVTLHEAPRLGPIGCSWPHGTLNELGAVIWVSHICAVDHARGARWEVLGVWHHHTNCLILRGDASVIKCGSYWDLTAWGI